MKKILGDKTKYYDQSNNAQVELFKDYFNKTKMIACGPTSFAMGLDIAGWPMDIFTPGEQPEDSILMIAHNPYNLNLFKEKRDLDYDKYPPNEVSQIYDVVAKILYNSDNVCKFKWGLTWSIIKENIINNIPMMIAGNFPAGGHYVLIVGFDDSKKTIIFNDPYKYQWRDKNGYNREMDLNFLNDKISKYRIEFYPYINNKEFTR